MLAESFVALLSRNVGVGKEGSESAQHDQSFGGVNVILFGDLHQFPPVAQPLSESLYRPMNLASDSFDRQMGRAIYEEFKTVVILKEQMRVTDPTWRDLLVHLRHGQVQERHIAILRKLIINQPKAAINFQSEPWKHAALVTPHHAVRKLWNESATWKWCGESGEQMFICVAEDRIGHRELTLAEHYCVAARGKTEKQRKRKDLPWEIELTKGMKVLVTDNVETDLDITNGARGEIVDIILHPEEPAIGNEPIVQLKYLSAYILVKLACTRASRLEGLDEAVIPVEVASTTMQITVQVHGKWIKCTVRC